MLSPKLETLNSNQTQMCKMQNSKSYDVRKQQSLQRFSVQSLRSRNNLLSFRFWIYLGFRVWCLEFKQLRISIFGFRIYFKAIEIIRRI
jgi:hypothetical protein